MGEWNRIFQLFQFSGILGQSGELHPKFRNEILEHVPFHTLTLPEFPESLVKWKMPIITLTTMLTFLLYFWWFLILKY